MFKEILNEDLNIFIDIDEFAEECILNGKKLLVVIDNEKLDRYKERNSELLGSELVLFYCKVSDLDITTIGGSTDFNNSTYNVISKEKQGNIYQIILERTTQGSPNDWV